MLKSWQRKLSNTKVTPTIAHSLVAQRAQEYSVLVTA
jgi:hypothetical protein